MRQCIQVLKNSVWQSRLTITFLSFPAISKNKTMLMLEELTNLKIALQFTNERNSVIAKVVRLVVGFYPVPLTRPSIPSPCCSALKQPQSPGFFYFLLWACVYSAPDLRVLSPFPACWVWQFSTLLYTLWAFAFLLPLCQSQSQPPSRFWDFPGVPFIPGAVSFWTRPVPVTQLGVFASHTCLIGSHTCSML